MKIQVSPLFLIGLCIPNYASAQPVDQEKRHPNLLVVMADQFRGSAFGFRHIEPVKTPNFDRFANKAVVCTQAVSGYPVSSPARGMFLSGAYPHVNGILTNCKSEVSQYNVELRKDLICWSDVLSQNGYNMGYIGKWHMDKPVDPFIDCSNNRGKVAWNEWCAPDRRHGFDYWVSYGTYDYHLRPLYWGKHSKRNEFYYVDQWGPEYETDLAVHYLDSISHSDRPFALMVSMNPPHTAYNLVPERYKNLYKDLNTDSIANSLPNVTRSDKKNQIYFKNSLADYYACISGVDEQFGRIINTLKANGQFDNTIVVFVSDHGDSMGMHDNIGKNICYEEAMHVPFLISYGSHLKPRIDNDLLLSLEDFCPTILSLLGYKEQIPSTVQTRDLSEYIKGKKKHRPTSQLYMKYEAVNSTKYNLKTGKRGLRNRRYTYTVQFVDGEITHEWLFDRKKDPYQLDNIVNDKKRVAKRLFKDMKKRLISINDPASTIERH